MVFVKSAWTNVPIPPDGMLACFRIVRKPERIPIPAGYLMVKNDADSLYVALDIIGDTTSDISAGVTDDYFWFVIDSDNDKAVTPNRDVLYSGWPGQGNRLGRWSEWPGRMSPGQLPTARSWRRL